MDNGVKTSDERSFLFVEFHELGSAEFSLNINHVTPMQVLALAGYLEFIAKHGLSKEEWRKEVAKQDEESRNKILLPNAPKIDL